MKVDLNRRKIAEKLAELPYSVEVALDETTEGQRVYTARVPELEGCFGQGHTIDEAISNLNEARVDFIESLLVDGVSVPQPSTLATKTSSSSSATVTLRNFQDPLNESGEEKPLRLYEAALHT